MDVIGWTIVLVSAGAGVIKLTGKYNGFAEQFSPIGGISSACGALALILMLCLSNSLCYDDSIFIIVLELIGILLLILAPFFVSASMKTGAHNGFILYRIACGVGVAFLAMCLLNRLTNAKRKDD